MVLVTTNGHCGVIKMGMAVNGDHISATSGKFVMHKIALTAHDAPLEMPDRSRAEPLHLHAAGAQAGAARARDDRPARGGGAEA